MVRKFEQQKAPIIFIKRTTKKEETFGQENKKLLKVKLQVVLKRQGIINEKLLKKKQER
jgi:hypothetical protein